VQAYQAMRGASFLVAVIFAAEIGDIRRFDTPRQLMAFLGLARRALDRQHSSAHQPDFSGQWPGATGADRSCLDLSLPGEGQRSS
jgi:hypothetical protein